ncbi:unnamed protein product [Protopolystoma xenopodis]|uniref:Uncharacterized protein n=1 Tax=Protopolystoma xenopodis TaxID=117903 RepID=A0A448XCD9_9PLAT|nr:unnamed protein product [Protopolystoma xenopodis]
MAFLESDICSVTQGHSCQCDCLVNVSSSHAELSHRLAPVHFRQDANSLSVLVSIRGVLPSSLRINWADHTQSTSFASSPSAQQSITKQGISPPQLLLFTCSSQGSGGFIQDWGIVLQCPAPECNFQSDEEAEEANSALAEKTDESSVLSERKGGPEKLLIPTAPDNLTGHIPSSVPKLIPAPIEVASSESPNKPPGPVTLVSSGRHSFSIASSNVFGAPVDHASLNTAPMPSSYPLPGSGCLSIPTGPIVISCDVSPANVCLVLGKPVGGDKSKVMWWPTLATGRTLGAGMESLVFFYPSADRDSYHSDAFAVNSGSLHLVDYFMLCGQADREGCPFLQD